LVDGVIGLQEGVVTVYGKEYIMSTESLSSITDNQSAVIHSYLLQFKRRLAMNVLLNISAITMHSSKMDLQRQPWESNGFAHNRQKDEVTSICHSEAWAKNQP
jgi:hypothetical protein